MNTNDVDFEQFLYEIIEELSRSKAPIVFKGGLALKDLLYLYNNELNINRRTIDIDANWISEYNEREITSTIEKALNKVNSTFKLELYREPSNNTSMGYKILDSNGEKITTIDLDIKDNPFYIECRINDVDIKYASFEKMMSDKLLSISGSHIFRRTKDILDIYMITKNNKIDIDKVFEILNWRFFYYVK